MKRALLREHPGYVAHRKDLNVGMYSAQNPVVAVNQPLILNINRDAEVNIAEGLVRQYVSDGVKAYDKYTPGGAEIWVAGDVPRTAHE